MSIKYAQGLFLIDIGRSYTISREPMVYRGRRARTSSQWGLAVFTNSAFWKRKKEKKILTDADIHHYDE